jgi:hypothetical protein
MSVQGNLNSIYLLESTNTKSWYESFEAPLILRQSKALCSTGIQPTIYRLPKANIPDNTLYVDMNVTGIESFLKADKRATNHIFYNILKFMPDYIDQELACLAFELGTPNRLHTKNNALIACSYAFRAAESQTANTKKTFNALSKLAVDTYPAGHVADFIYELHQMCSPNDALRFENLALQSFSSSKTLRNKHSGLAIKSDKTKFFYPDKWLQENARRLETKIKMAPSGPFKM